MKRTIVFFIVLFIAVCVKAQTPEWQWATSIVGNGDEWNEGTGITTDDAGNIYVIGRFSETATFGSYSLTSNGDWDLFVAKMDANGNWIWAIQPDESSNVDGLSITTDDSGNVYVVGFFLETLTFGPYSLISNGDSDAFIVKIDENSNWIWANSYGGSEWDSFSDIIIDDSDNIYINGSFEDPLTLNRFIITKLDTNGNWLMGIPEDENHAGNGIAIDNSGNIYLTGTFQETVTFGSYSLTSYGHTDMFVAMMDANGSCQWAIQAGGSSYDSGRGITSDDAGNIYVAGRFTEAATFGTQYIGGNGFYNAFVAKIDANGNWLWITQPGGGDNLVHPNGISTDITGNIYITGSFVGVVDFGSETLICYGENDIFVAKMEANGNWLWGVQAGGCNSDIGKGITINDTGDIYITGHFTITASFGSFSITGSLIANAFVAKLSCNTDISDENVNIPASQYLSNHPNPFNPSTTIEFSIEQNQQNEQIELEIFNIKGEKIKTLNVILSGVEGSVMWNGTDNYQNKVSSGVHFYQLKVNGKSEAVKKCLLLK